MSENSNQFKYPLELMSFGQLYATMIYDATGSKSLFIFKITVIYIASATEQIFSLLYYCFISN